MRRNRADRQSIPPGLVARFAIAFVLPASAGLAAEPAGEAIYRTHCVRCHGPDGRGTADVPAPLEGDLSVNQLAATIAETMPEDAPGLVTGDAARAVAAYVHDSFYSTLARDRSRPARVELARLTSRQHRTVLADLIGSFRGTAPAIDARRGLRAEYYEGRGFDRRLLVMERIDPVVDFDFGVEGPDPERFEPSRFAIRWAGAIVPPETGFYEFVVVTEHSARLAVDRAWYEPPSVDAWVASGGDREHRANVFLLGGRAYPVRLEFSKANQGVDSRKHEHPTHAAIALFWKPPHGVLEPVPERCLIPQDAPETFVAANPLPPDDTSTGYERGTNVSREWFAATAAIAGEATAYVRDHVDHLARVKRDAADRGEKLRQFAAAFAERAFRRPLADDVRSRFVDHPFADATDLDVALERALLGILQSPRFLFREVDGGGDPFDTASRLSFGLWDSIPDQALWQAAASGRLGTADEVRRQAERMLADRRTRAKLRDVLFVWLRLTPAPEVAKDPAIHPAFNAEVAADLRTSLDLFLDDVMWGEAADWRRLFTDRAVPVNPRLAAALGAAVDANAFRSAGTFRALVLDEGRRAGLLSHPYLMSVLAHQEATSPIHRGVFVARTLLGNVLKPPQEAIAPLAPDRHPGLSTRERVTLQTSPVACRTCHAMINPLGFALEEFDAIGRHRAVESVAGAERPIDGTGSYQPRRGEATEFRGAAELGRFLADSDDAREAFVRAIFQGMVRQPVRAWGPETLDRLCHSFRESGHDIRRLLVDIMVVAAFDPTHDFAMAAGAGEGPPDKGR